MLNKNFKYTVIALILFGLSGCNQRTIVLHPGENGAQPQRTQPVIKSPEIKEEILINQNPNLGNPIDVPTNNPLLGQAVGDYNDSNHYQEENITEEPVVENGVIERISFPIDEYKYIKKTGGSTVSGSIYVENSHNAEKIMGKKVKLYLNPVTSYSRQWYQESYLGGYKMSKSDNRLYNYLKYTVSNSNGKFNFFGLASGNYYLVGTITCGQECGYSETKTVLLVQEIFVGNGVTNVNLMKHVP
ncbi:hypothetical protein KKC13_07840 [bacterium]|nr:hypothetical protein [bacterium]MBU1959064.1 hypothetical protein [bacterium]